MNGGKVQAYSSILIIILLASVIMLPYSMGQKSLDEIKGVPAGWTDDINLSKSSTGDSKCNIAASGNDVHVIWRHTYVSALDYEVVYQRSNDGGMTWTPFVNISNSLIMADDSDIAVFNDNIHVVWENVTGGGIDEIYYRNSLDGGLSWNPEKQISAVTGAFALGPNIFVNDSNVHISWHDKRDGADGEIYYRRSLDGGITWDDGQGVDVDRQVTFSPAAISGGKLAGDGSNISVVWSDERDGDFDVYWMISKDNGQTWEDGLGNPNVDRKISNSNSWSIDSTIAVNGTNIHIVWVDEIWPGPVYEIYYRNSTDNGASWNPITTLSGPNTGSSAPDIRVFGNNIWMMWSDDRDSSVEVFFKNSTDGGITWDLDTRLTEMDGFLSGAPKIALNGNIHVIWNDQRDAQSEIYYKRYPDFPPDPTYNITLDEGWNLISLPLEQSNESIDQVLQSINGKWDYIQVYDAINEIWLSNATFKPDQLNDFNTLNHKQGFWINITEPGGTILSCSGYDPPSTSIPLYAGWNLVGYPSLANETVANALWGTGADRVEVFDELEPYQIKEVGPTYLMKPGEGYWVHVPADTTWIINW